MSGACDDSARADRAGGMRSQSVLCSHGTEIMKQSPAARRSAVRKAAIRVHLCSSVVTQSGTLSAARKGRWRSDLDAAWLLILRHERNHRCTQMHTDGSCSGSSVRARRSIGRNQSWRGNAGRVTGPGCWSYPPDSQTNRCGLKCCWPANAGIETAESTTCPSTEGRQPAQPFSVALRVPRSSSVLRFFSRSREERRQPDAHPQCRTLPDPHAPNRLATPPAPLTGLPASTLK
jgi:hypothetical protein